MNSQDLIVAANEERPDLMEKTAAILNVVGKFDPWFAQGILEDIDGVTQHALYKVAASPAAVWGAAVGGTLLSGLLGSVATDLYDVAKRGLTKTRNFNEIMKVNPELRHIDKERLRRSYDALHRYAPEFTADPLLGGTLLSAVAKVPGNEHVVIKDLLNARKNLQDATHTQYRPGTVGIELESDADIKREVGQRTQEIQMEKMRQGFTTQRDLNEAAINVRRDSVRRDHEVNIEGTIKRVARETTQQHAHDLSVRDDFPQQFRLEDYRAKLQDDETRPSVRDRIQAAAFKSDEARFKAQEAHEALEHGRRTRGRGP